MSESSKCIKAGFLYASFVFLWLKRKKDYSSVKTTDVEARFGALGFQEPSVQKRDTSPILLLVWRLVVLAV